ncbi:MAG: hypothetical protein WBC51_23840 [Vicinamibacterales bacterium]
MRQQPASSAAQPARSPATQAVLLSDSEISVTESGGIAGRVHAVRLVVSAGRVNVEYRAREAPPSAPPRTGSLEVDRYTALWRELEAARLWEIHSPAPARGADLIHTELRVRLGETSHVVGWDDGGELPPEIRRLAEIGRRILAAGRESAATR